MDSNSDSLSPVSGLLSHALYNPKGKLTVFQVLLPSQFREVRSHTENLSTCALLTSGYKSSQRKQNNELTEVVSGVENQGTWDMARRTPEVCFPVKTFPSIFVSLSPRQRGRLTVMRVVTQTGTHRERQELACSTRHPLWPAYSGQERGPCGHWEPLQLPLPLLLWEAKTESQFAQQHRHLTQPNCQFIKAAHCPTDRGFPCFTRGACCSCRARSQQRLPLPMPAAQASG